MQFFALILVFFVGAIVAQPQRHFSFGQFGSEQDTAPPTQESIFRRPGQPIPQRPNSNPSSITTATPNSPSPQYLACLQSCPSTSEYNPICGSDSVNYHNNGRLECAIRCGQNVVAVRSGTCQPL